MRENFHPDFHPAPAGSIQFSTESSLQPSETPTCSNNYINRDPNWRQPQSSSSVISFEGLSSVGVAEHFYPWLLLIPISPDRLLSASQHCAPSTWVSLIRRSEMGRRSSLYSKALTAKPFSPPSSTNWEQKLLIFSPVLGNSCWGISPFLMTGTIC